MSDKFLFTYGTLRQSKKPSSFVRGFQMYNAGAYPYVVRTDNPDHVVKGELLHIPNDDQWAKIDKYEGVDRGLYYKSTAEVFPIDDDAKSIEAVIYIATSQWPTLVPEGEWVK